MTARDSDESRYIVPAVARAAAILQLFSTGRRTISAAELARELDIPRSTVFRLARTLEQLKLLKRVNGVQSYQLGIGILGLGFEYLASLDLVEVSRPILEQLRDDTALSCHMVVRDEQDVVVVLKAAGSSAYSSGLNVGKRLPAHGTVLGRMVLSDFSLAELQTLFPDNPLPTFTDQTPTSVEELAALLAEDRNRGYAVSNSYFEPGISSVAAPIFDRSGRVKAAINVTRLSGPVADDEIIQKVCRAAKAVSTGLSYTVADSTVSAKRTEHAR